jgi:uncharacterized protein (TIGR00297 family)
MIETIFAANGYLSTLPGRVAVGLPLALVVAGIAWRAGSLNRSGFVAATACGTLCVIGGWRWASLLVAYFVAASALTRAGNEKKAARVGWMVSKGGHRDFTQVIANGGVYSIVVAATVVITIPWLAWGAVGALAAASSDTWATELGTWLGGRPRSIATGAYVRPGESGGITMLGTLGSIGGALWVAVVVALIGSSRGLGIAAVVAGVGGSVADSLLGATVQERRQCDVCGDRTERAVHRCGSVTRRIGGIPGLDNDVVNILSTFVGFMLGVIVYYIAAGLGSWSTIV